MPLFITQGRFTTEAVRGMMSSPENRERAVQDLIAQSGGTLLSYYMTFGEYDFLIVSEGPIEGMATSVIVAAAGGAVTDMRTSLALTASEMEGSFARAGALAASYKPAGAQTGSVL
ncbi:GYD domain-containing protein [Methylobacterium planeticum]|uniref:GYD domain-containing protein n=1 Tax=Methylobacterium planeticum TaxID=2615211 RepID=A0A6N6MFG0_9HYPH|nr:GYD domain-containing protein [Methylobacterium planeticum]KAB1068484.1 GYD domain-containing protein [Methylobacterium planeticum]